MKQGLTEVGCIIDKSGSMSSVWDDAIGGFNTFLKKQKEAPGDCNMTLVLFSTGRSGVWFGVGDPEYIVLHEGIPIKDVQPLTTTRYEPNGMTALYDAIGKTIDRIGTRLANTPEEERPERVLIAILTDGCENDSHVYSRERVFEMIRHQEDTYNWEFIYLGANQDAFAQGKAMGIKLNNIANYTGDSVGTKSVYEETLTSCTLGYRAGRGIKLDKESQ